MIVSSIPPAALTPSPAAVQPLAAPIALADAVKYPTPPSSGLTQNIDPQLGITVLTLRSDNGAADSTIPTTQQLKAYVAAQFTPPPKSQVA